MDFFLQNWFLFLTVFISGFLLFSPIITGKQTGDSTQHLSPQAAVQLMNRERALVIDTSESQVFQSCHISGAKNIPLADLAEQLPKTAKNKTTPLIFVCGSGSLSSKALRTAKDMGYEKPYLLSGGIKAWKSENLPLEIPATT